MVGGLAPWWVYVIPLFVYTWRTLADFGIHKSAACVYPGPLGIHDSPVCVYLADFADFGIRKSPVYVYLTDLCIPNFALSGICRHQTSPVPAGTIWRDRNDPRVRYTQLAEVYTTRLFVYTKREGRRARGKGSVSVRQVSGRLHSNGGCSLAHRPGRVVPVPEPVYERAVLESKSSK